MDEVLNNMTAKLIPLYNAKYDDNLKYEDITEYNIRPFIKPECKHLFEEFVDDAFYASLDVAEGAVEVLSELQKENDIYFATAGHPYTMRARDNWLEQHFGSFYRSGSLISIREKQLLKVDVLVDDFEENIIGGSYYGVLVDKPWNRCVPTRLYRMQRIAKLTELPKIIHDLKKGLIV